MAYDTPKAAHFPVYDLNTKLEVLGQYTLAISWEVAEAAQEICSDLLHPTEDQREKLDSMVIAMNESLKPHDLTIQPRFSWLRD